MKASNNLNQLLSRVKTIFGRKTTPVTNTPLEAEPPTGLSVVSDPRLRAAFADIEKYLTENYGTPTANCAIRTTPMAPVLPPKLQRLLYRS